MSYEKRWVGLSAACAATAIMMFVAVLVVHAQGPGTKHRIDPIRSFRPDSSFVCTIINDGNFQKSRYLASSGDKISCEYKDKATGTSSKWDFAEAVRDPNNSMRLTLRFKARGLAGAIPATGGTITITIDDGGTPSITMNPIDVEPVTIDPCL